jgi:hypothetical protein
MVYRAWGQNSLAHTAFETARAALERRLAVLPDNHIFLAELGFALAGLGRSDAAIDQLQIVLSKPGPLSPAWLRADPLWAPLRSNPRFERLVAGP